MKIGKKKIWSMLVIAALLFFNICPTVYAIDPTPWHANGNPITIGEVPYTWASNSEIFGGSVSGILDSTNMTIGKNANLFTNSYGGSETGDITGESKITYNGNPNIDFTSAKSGYQIYNLYGGNKGNGTVGSTRVDMNSGWVRGWIVGGSTAGTITGDSIVNVTGGLVGSTVDGYSSGQGEVYGGAGGTAILNGNTYVTISGNKFVSGEYKPGDAVTIIRQHVLGGPFTGGTVNGNTNVNITGGSILGQVNGGGGGGRSCKCCKRKHQCNNYRRRNY